jgi:putative SOS response-associated peptidase YedK
VAARDAINLPEGESWNVAPSEPSMVVRSDPQGTTRDVLHWGFLDQREARPRFFNARLETADTLRTFKNAWHERRCVVPVDGWYEWLTVPDGKQPYFFHLPDDVPIFLAGLWERRTFTLVTMEAQELSRYHDRRPVAFGVDEANAWICGMPTRWQDTPAMAIPASKIVAYPVSRRLNSSNYKVGAPELVQSGASPESTVQLGEMDLFSKR